MEEVQSKSYRLSLPSFSVQDSPNIPIKPHPTKSKAKKKTDYERLLLPLTSALPTSKVFINESELIENKNNELNRFSVSRLI